MNMEEITKTKSLEREEASENDKVDDVIKLTPFEEVDDKIKIALEAALEKKGFNPAILDLRKITSFTEFFVVVSGNNQRQVQAIADEVSDQLKDREKSKPTRTEGYDTAEWVLLDYGDFIVHIFGA